MNRENNLYNEEKTAQLVSLLIYLNGGSMNMLKLVKLVYNIDRESFKRWYRPVTYDNFCSMKHGQVVSKTYDNVKYKNRNVDNYWNSIFETKEASKNVYSVNLKKSYDKHFIEKLSMAEINLAIELFNRYKNKTAGEMIKEHHDQNLFPEYRKTENTSIPTEYSYLLEKIGIPKNHIQKIEKDLEGRKYLASIK